MTNTNFNFCCSYWRSKWIWNVVFETRQHFMVKLNFHLTLDSKIFITVQNMLILYFYPTSSDHSHKSMHLDNSTVILKYLNTAFENVAPWFSSFWKNRFLPNIMFQDLHRNNRMNCYMISSYLLNLLSHFTIERKHRKEGKG